MACQYEAEKIEKWKWNENAVILSNCLLFHNCRTWQMFQCCSIPATFNTKHYHMLYQWNKYCIRPLFFCGLSVYLKMYMLYTSAKIHPNDHMSISWPNGTPNITCKPIKQQITKNHQKTLMNIAFKCHRISRHVAQYPQKPLRPVSQTKDFALRYKIYRYNFLVLSIAHLTLNWLGKMPSHFIVLILTSDWLIYQFVSK